MKKFILALAFLMPAAANAALVYSQAQTQLDNTSYTLTDEEAYGWSQFQLGQIVMGANDYTYGWDMELYFIWDVVIDIEASHIPTGVTHLWGDGTTGSTFPFTHEWVYISTGDAGNYRVAGQIRNDSLLADFTNMEEAQWYLSGGFAFDLFLGHGGLPLGTTIAFGEGNRFTVTDARYMVPEPAAASMLALGLAFIGYRRFKK